MIRQIRLLFLDRILFLAILMTALGSPHDTVARDYTVSYAFAGATDRGAAATATNPVTEEGTRRDCTYGTFCKLALNKSDLEIWFGVSRAERGQTTISVTADGGRTHGVECCLFGDGQSRYSGPLWDPLVRLYIYDGHRRRRNEVVQNVLLGTLYLQLSDLK
jgi:hypothetical protein